MHQRPTATPPPRGSAAATAGRSHPLLEALTHALDATTTRSSGSHSARPAALPTVAAPQRRQSSATLRRKLQALGTAHTAGLRPTHALGSAAAAAAAPHGRSVSGDLDSSALPASLLPPSAHVHSRVPVTNFVAGLSRLPAHDRRWETLTFPSAQPAAAEATNGSGGETEIRRLSEWFDESWAKIEQDVQLQAVRDKKSANLRLTARGAAPIVDLTDEKSSSDPTASPALPAALAHQLTMSREKLCFLVFHELLRHVTGSCRRRGALLEKVWLAHHRLTEHRIGHRIDEVITMSETNASLAADRMAARFETLLRDEKAALIKAGVDLTYLSAELEAKSRIIENLQSENDKDLLFSNQIVVHKEMAYLRQNRDLKLTQQDLTKLTDDLRFVSADKLSLEDAVTKLEDEKEELILQCNAVQELVDARLRGKVDRDTQYDVNDAPPEPTAHELLVRDAAISIQRLFRGFCVRRKLKTEGLLSRKLILKKLTTLRERANAAAGVGPGRMLPVLPKAFSHLLSPIDMDQHRDHFVRVFSRRNLVKWIHKTYTEKSTQDAQYARTGKHRKDLAPFIYDQALLRHGARDAAEMDLMDLFVSVEKYSDVSARVRLFSLFLNDGFRHRKVLAINHHVLTDPQADPTNNDGEEQPEAHPVATVHREQGASRHYHMNELERHAHELKLRLTLSLSGARQLSSRVLDFYLRFLACGMQYGRGPFQTVSDNHDGTMWIELASIVDLASKVFNRFPAYLLQATLTKLQHNKTSASRTAVLAMDGLHATATASNSADVLHQAQTQALTSPGSDAAQTPHRFVDFDVMMEVLVEAYLDEDARMHHSLHDLFRHPNPNAAVNHQKDRQAAAAARHAQQATASSARAAARDDGADFSEGLESNSQLEPEMFSFVHFCDVVRSLGGTWDEDRLLRMYHQSVQRAIHRAVTIEDFVVTVRSHGCIPVELDFDLVESSARPSASANADESLLPSLTDDGIDRVEEDEFERRHQELKDKIKEVEAAGLQRMEYAHRRHEKELGMLKQANERELTILQQAHHQSMEANKRLLESDRHKSANEYNLLFESTTAEIAQLKQTMEQREQRDAERASLAQSTFNIKLSECDTTLSMLQTKLQSVRTKYLAKKSSSSTLQARVTELEQKLERAPGGASQPPDAHALAEYKRVDEDNRKINASLRSELSAVNAKYKELVKYSKDLLRNSQQQSATAANNAATSAAGSTASGSGRGNTPDADEAR